MEHPRLRIEVRVRPRAGARARCSHCRRRAPGYDTQAVRRFDLVPLWHIPVVFLYAMRRVCCPRCGVRVEALPWATGKHRLTDAHAWFLAAWAKRLSWQEVAAAFPTSWDTVYRAVRMAVDCGLAHRNLTNIEAIGADELSRRRGQRYLTLVYQIDGHCKRLLWIRREREPATLEGFFDWFGAARSAEPRSTSSACVNASGLAPDTTSRSRRSRGGGQQLMKNLAETAASLGAIDVLDNSHGVTRHVARNTTGEIWLPATPTPAWARTLIRQIEPHRPTT